MIKHVDRMAVQSDPFQEKFKAYMIYSRGRAISSNIKKKLPDYLTEDQKDLLANFENTLKLLHKKQHFFGANDKTIALIKKTQYTFMNDAKTDFNIICIQHFSMQQIYRKVLNMPDFEFYDYSMNFYPDDQDFIFSKMTGPNIRMAVKGAYRAHYEDEKTQKLIHNIKQKAFVAGYCDFLLREHDKISKQCIGVFDFTPE